MRKENEVCPLFQLSSSALLATSLLAYWTGVTYSLSLLLRSDPNFFNCGILSFLVNSRCFGDQFGDPHFLQRFVFRFFSFTLPLGLLSSRFLFLLKICTLSSHPLPSLTVRSASHTIIHVLVLLCCKKLCCFFLYFPLVHCPLVIPIRDINFDSINSAAVIGLNSQFFSMYSNLVHPSAAVSFGKRFNSKKCPLPWCLFLSGNRNGD